MEFIHILGINITNIGFSQAIGLVKQWLEENKEKHYIVTPNPEAVMMARKDGEFRDILNHADLALCDGVGLCWAGKILGLPFYERITGVDFMLGLCQFAETEGYTIGLLGAGDGIAKKTAEKLKEKFPKLKINFIQEEWEQNIRYPISDIRYSVVDILFVALGMPKQEKWIAHNINIFPAKVFMTVGGSFDYISENVPRAPENVRKIGLEWLYRLFKEPWRFKRQLSIWKFGFLVIKNKIF